MKTKKDRIFIIVLAIVAGSLVYDILGITIGITSGLWASLPVWLVLIAKIVALIGVLWLLRTNKRSRRIDKEREANCETEDMD